MLLTERTPRRGRRRSVTLEQNEGSWFRPRNGAEPSPGRPSLCGGDRVGTAKDSGLRTGRSEGNPRREGSEGEEGGGVMKSDEERRGMNRKRKLSVVGETQRRAG